jgi:hypothetical protein
VLQALSLELISKYPEVLKNGPQPVPVNINNRIAQLMVENFK